MDLLSSLMGYWQCPANTQGRTRFPTDFQQIFTQISPNFHQISNQFPSDSIHFPVLKKGVTPDKFYVLIDGKVRVEAGIAAKGADEKSGDSKEDQKNSANDSSANYLVLTPPAHFGAEGLLRSAPVTESYTAVDKSVFLTLSVVAFERMCGVCDSFSNG
jgi:CRP-like cAMP-binding protein